MARIRCRYIGCIYLDDGYCSAPEVDLDPDEGCRTFAQIEDPFDDDWDDESDDFDDWEQEELGDDLIDDDDDEYL